jgi:tartrate-resistant acid phosphatase type 5
MSLQTRNRFIPIFLICLIVISAGLFFFTLRKRSNVGGKDTMNTSTEKIASPKEQFILMGDVGTAAPQQFQVADAIKSKCDTEQNCKAVFILGDIIYENGITSAKDPQLQTKLEKPYKDINLPFYLLFGNHDYLACSDCYLQFASGSAKWHFPKRYYQQDFDEVSFFVIDTEKFDIEQQKWLVDQIAGSTKEWKVVLGHRPIVSEESTKKGEDWSGRKKLQEIVCSSADYYISGHAHLLEDRGEDPDCKAHFLISGAGGSYVREITKPFTGKFYAEENGFLSLTVNNKEAKYEFINKEGKVLSN